MFDGSQLAALKRLRVFDGYLVGEGAADALAAALSRLPAGLEHLCIVDLSSQVDVEDREHEFHTTVLQQLQQLTYLELVDMYLLGPQHNQPALQPLEALTGLLNLQLVLRYEPAARARVCDSMLAGMCHLTLLHLARWSFDGPIELEPGVLANKKQLQHLYFNNCMVLGGAAGLGQLLSHMPHMQQLVHFHVVNSLFTTDRDMPSAAAYAALTASSKLQRFCLRDCQLPADVWQQMFPAGRQLPHLTFLTLARCDTWLLQAGPSLCPAAAPEGTSLSSCCPDLQYLDISGLQYSNESLAPLSGLSGLHQLCVEPAGWESAEGLQAVCQLTRLRGLAFGCPSSAVEQLQLQLTQMTRLTALRVHHRSPPSTVDGRNAARLHGGTTL
jgi:hypothetical protein